jgi:hypothetical protein
VRALARPAPGAAWLHDTPRPRAPCCARRRSLVAATGPPAHVNSQNSCTNSIDKGVSRSYVPLNEPCHKPIKRVQGILTSTSDAGAAPGELAPSVLSGGACVGGAVSERGVR